KLVNYRIHENSLTVIANKINVNLKIIKIQLYFILYEFLKLRLNKFNLLVIKQLIKNFDKLYLSSFIAGGLSKISKYRAKIKTLSNFLKIRLKFKSHLKNRKTSKINILYIIPHMVVGGADKVNIDIISSLDKEQFTIHIITTNKNNNVWRERFKPFADNILHLSELFDEKYYNLFILYLIRKLKINLIFISNSLQGYTSLPVIKQSFKNIKVVDLLHGEGGKLDGGGFPFYSFKYDQYIDLRIVINDYLKNHLISKFNINPQKILIIKNGVDVNYFDPELVHDNSFIDIYKIDESDIVITFVGRLDFEKHPENVIYLANSILNSGYKNYKIFVAGNGSEYKTIDLLIKENKLEKNVFLLGHVENIRQLLKDSDILFLCSEMEGLPLIILEAMAMRLPVIASNVGGVNEIVDNYENGFIVDYDYNFIKNCSEKIVHLSKEDMKIIGENNRKKICEMFSLQKMVNDYSNAFYKLINTD
ncbi:glycosyltransferase family 4 protein, partial [Dolichospermum sp. ST_sed3]|nr:glycosyltransferase family 4 protein [Dolichospermum sp. ST_sed3]